MRNKLKDLRYKSGHIDPPSGEAEGVRFVDSLVEAGGTNAENREVDPVVAWMRIEDNANRPLGKDIVLRVAP